jgi:hypothetical protein
MDKRFFNLINVLLAMMICLGLLQSILRFILGADLLRQESYLTVLAIQIAIFVCMSLLVMKYYWLKKYTLTFSISIALVLSTLLHSGIFYLTLLTFKEQSLYLPTLILNLGITLMYGLSLAFSNSGSRLWLRVSGIYVLITSVPILVSLIWFLLDRSVQTALTLEKLTPWLAMLNSLGPIFFVLNFRDEARQLEENPKGIWNQSQFAIWQWLTVGLAIAALAFGIKLSADVYWSKHWSKHNYEQTKILAERFEARTFVGSKGDTLYYRFLKPLNYDTTKTYPLLISLPYGGQPPTDKIRQIEGAAAAVLLSTDENRKKYPAFIFIPNCPAGSGWGGIPGYPSVDSLVYEAIVSLNKEVGLDAKRRYVTGISRGGYGTWNFIMTRPDLFAAAIPVCGGGTARISPGVAEIAVWAFHGEKDKNVPVAGSRDMISALKKAGGHPRYTEFANEGHSIWDRASTTPGLWDWLFAQRKK